MGPLVHYCFRLVAKGFLFGWIVFLLCASQRAMCQSESDDAPDLNRQELIDRIRFQHEVCLPNKSVEIIAKGETTQQYGDEVLLVGNSVIRYVMDLEDDRMFLGFGYKPGVDDTVKTAPAIFGATDIMGNSVKEFSASRRQWIDKGFSSFDEALKAVDGPIPFFYAVQDFGSHNPASNAMADILSLVSDEANAVFVKNDDRTLKFSLRIEHEPTRFDRWTWTFDSQSGVMLSRTVDRAINSEFRRYYDCFLVWEKDREGAPQLGSFLANQLVVREKEGFAGGRQLGTESHVFDLEYQPLKKDVAKEFQASKVQTQVDLVEFVGNAKNRVR